MVADLKDKMPSWLTSSPMSVINFLAIFFVGGMLWSTTQSDIKNNKLAIEDLRAEVRQIRAQDTTTSVAVLKSDVTYIKDSLLRIEGRLDSRSLTPR